MDFIWFHTSCCILLHAKVSTPWFSCVFLSSLVAISNAVVLLCLTLAAFGLSYVCNDKLSVLELEMWRCIAISTIHHCSMFVSPQHGGLDSNMSHLSTTVDLVLLSLLSLFSLLYLTPRKIHSWNLKITPIEKENHLNHPTPWLWVQNVNFPGCKCTHGIHVWYICLHLP